MLTLLFTPAWSYRYFFNFCSSRHFCGYFSAVSHFWQCDYVGVFCLLACARFIFPVTPTAPFPPPPLPLLSPLACVQVHWNSVCLFPVRAVYEHQRVFFSVHTEWTASGPWGDIHWIWQNMYWIRITDCTFNKTLLVNKTNRFTAET